jgi:hypothetical protein
MNPRLNLWNKPLPSSESNTPTQPVSAPTPSSRITIDHARSAVSEPVQRVARPPVVTTFEAKPQVQPPPRDRRIGKRPYKRVPKEKTRRHAVSICVSEEEENLLRTFATTLDRSFSDWARGILFKAMGRKLPKRGSVENIDPDTEG